MTSSPTGTGQPSRDLCYVYGFLPSPEGPAPIFSTAVEPGCPPEVLPHCDAAALVSRVPAHIYGAEALQPRLEGDLEWLTAHVQRHNQVLVEAMASGPVIPCRFGLLFHDPRSVRGIIERYRVQIHAALRTIGRAGEWSVKQYLVLPPKRPPPGEGAGGRSGRGANYLLARKRQRDERRSASGRARAFSQVLLERLGEVSEDRRELPPRDLGTAQGGTPIASFSFLVAPEGDARFRQTVEALAEEGEGRASRITLTGPLPPYTFAGDLFQEDPEGSDER